MITNRPLPPAVDPADRSRLRELVRRRDDLIRSGTSCITDDELRVILDRIDQRLLRARQAAGRSNRAKGLVRELTLQRQQVVADVERQRIEIHGVHIEGDGAHERLLAGAPPELRAEVEHAQQVLTDAQAAQAACTETTPTHDRIDTCYRVHQAKKDLAAAVDAAIDWGCDVVATQDSPPLRACERSPAG
jgi:hypothetical protein